jgi:hypothetical protein
MISGRGLGHTGGTLDKMDSIPGYVSQPDNSLFRKVTREAAAPSSARRRSRARRQAPLWHPRRHRDGRIDPADHRLDPVEEARRGLGALVLDVKKRQWRLHGDARATPSALATSLVEVANGAGLPTTALITDMNEPLASRRQCHRGAPCRRLPMEGAVSSIHRTRELPWRRGHRTGRRAPRCQPTRSTHRVGLSNFWARATRWMARPRSASVHAADEAGFAQAAAIVKAAYVLGDAPACVALRLCASRASEPETWHAHSSSS